MIDYILLSLQMIDYIFSVYSSLLSNSFLVNSFTHRKHSSTIQSLASPFPNAIKKPTNFTYRKMSRPYAQVPANTTSNPAHQLIPILQSPSFQQRRWPRDPFRRIVLRAQKHNPHPPSTRVARPLPRIPPHSQ